MIMKRILILLAAIVVLGSCGQTNGNNQTANATSSNDNTRTQILVSTSMGDIILELYNETPLHRENFIKLVEEGFYDNTLFHRVIKGFMIQGGDPDSKIAQPGQQLGMGGPGYTTPAEFEDQFIHQKGALAAARQGDHVNPQKESSGSQFYIVHGRVFSHEELETFEQRSGKVFSNEQKKVYTTTGGAPHLDGDYTVFGKTVQGMEVIDSIAAVPTDGGNRPLEDIVITMSVIK